MQFLSSHSQTTLKRPVTGREALVDRADPLVDLSEGRLVESRDRPRQSEHRGVRAGAHDREGGEDEVAASSGTTPDTRRLALLALSTGPFS
jgi:hypothetical protein